MAFFRCGAGLSLDLTNPDVVSQSNISGNSNKNITVTQLPRFVVFLGVNAGNAGRFAFAIYDVANDKFYYASYTGSYSKSSGSGKPTNITAVTSTTVTVRNASGSSYTTTTLIYY